MATSARRSIEEDLARIRAEAQAGAPAGPVTPTGRSIEDDLAAVRIGNGLRSIGKLKVPAIASDATRSGPDLRRGTHEAGLGERVALGAMGLLTHPQEVVLGPLRAVRTAAQFMGQSAAETTLPADVRAQALADPARIAEEDAALAGLQLAVPTIPATGIIGRAVVGAGTGAVYSPEDPLVGGILGGAAGAAGGVIARERLSPGLRILVPRGAPPADPITRPFPPELPPGPPVAEPVRAPDQTRGGRHAVVDAEIIPEPAPGQPLLPRLRTPAPEERAYRPKPSDQPPVAPPQAGPILLQRLTEEPEGVWQRAQSEIKGRVGSDPEARAHLLGELAKLEALATRPDIATHPLDAVSARSLDRLRDLVGPKPEPAAPVVPEKSTGSIENDLAAIRGTPKAETPAVPSLRDARGKMPANLTKAPIESLAAEYRRLIDTGEKDKGFVAGVVDSPEFMEHHEMPGMAEDRRGVKNYERMGPAYLAHQRVLNREKTLTRIETELKRRGIEPGEAYYMAEEAAGGVVGERRALTPAQREAFEKARARPSVDHSILSPSGRVSKASRARAIERAGRELFGEEGLQKPEVAQPTEREADLRKAKEFRDLAARGMSPRKYARLAGELEAKWGAAGAPVVDDISAKRAAMPNDLRDDLNLLGEEARWQRAVMTPGSDVEVVLERHPKSYAPVRVTRGTVITGATEPANLTSKKGRALVEFERDGKKVRQWVTSTNLSPYSGSSGVGERVTHIDPAQFDLFKKGVPSPDSARLTFGSQAEKDALIQRVQREAGPMAETEPAQPSSAQRIRAIRQPGRAWVDIRGQKVTTLPKLHQLLTPFRDAKAEAIGTVLLDDAGNVVSHTLETSGALNYVSAGDVPKWVHQMVARAKRAGATKVLLHHNHPSGDPTPSWDDRSFTVLVTSYLKKNGLTLVGHYIIDHTKGTWLEAIPGQMKPGEREWMSVNETPVEADVRALGTDWTEKGGIRIKDYPDLHALARAADPEKSLSVAYLSANLTVVALEPHLREKLATAAEWIPQRMRAHGAASVIVVIPHPEGATFVSPNDRGPVPEDVRALMESSLAKGAPSRMLGGRPHAPLVDIGYVWRTHYGEPRIMSLDKARLYEAKPDEALAKRPEKDARLPQRLFEPGKQYGVREEPAEYGKKRKEEFDAARKAGIKSGLTPDQANAYAAAAKDIDFDGAKATAHAKAEAGGMKQQLRRWADAAADQTRAIDRLSRKAVERGMPPEKAPEYELALSYNSDDTIRRALYEAPEMATTHGILDPITREPMGPTLESVVAPLGRDPEKVRQAFTYVVALRKVGRGLKATAGSEEELAAATRAAEALGKVPMYQKFAKDLEAHLDAIGRYAVRSGLWTLEQWEQLKNSDLFYVPFKRLMTHIEPPPGKTTYGTRRANVGTGIETFEGSRRFLANPVEAVAGYDARIIRRADAYRVGSSVIDALTQWMGEEGKAILTPLEENDPAVKAFTAAAVRRNLDRSGLTPAEVGMVADLSTPMIDPHNPVVWRHSKTGSGREYFLLNEPELYKALVATRADSPLGTGALMTAFRLARRLMTVTATGINPRFALGLNVARDVPQAIMQNKGIRPDDIASAALEAMKAVIGRSEFSDLMARHGMGSASIYAHAVNAEAAARKLAPVTQLQRISSKIGGIAGKPLEIAERIGAASDLVGRLSAARAVHRNEIKAGRTPRGAAARAATTGIRATVNFNRRAGTPLMQFLEQSVPFFGAAVRSTVRAGEAVAERPKRVGAAVAILALAVIAEWAYSRRDKEKRRAQVDRPATERNRFLQFGGVRYPLSQEMALVAAGIRSALAQISQDDPDNAQQLKEAIYNLLPPVVSDLVQGDVIAPWPGWHEIQEISRNKTSYGQRPIVPERLQDLPPALRRTETTPPTFDVMADAARKFAVVIPGLAETSPLETEHLVRGFLGNMTPLLTMVTDAMVVSSGAGKNLPVTVPVPASAHPLNPASAFIVRDPPSRTSSESWFYARDKEFTQGRNAERVVRKMEDKTETAAGRQRVVGTKELLGGRKWALNEDTADDVRVMFTEAKHKLAEYREAETGIRQRVNDGALDPKLARPLLDALTLERQVMLRDVRANLMKLGVP